MTPDEEIPIKNRITGNLTKFRGFVIEAQTLDGLSGAPVFVRYTNSTGMYSGQGRVVAYSDSVRLLGVWNGSWDLQAGPTLTRQIGRDAKVPVGMGIATPAERIMEILNGAELRQLRTAETLAAQAAASDASNS